MFIKIEQRQYPQVLHCLYDGNKKCRTSNKTRHSVLIPAEKEAFLKALFIAFSMSEKIDLQKHLTFAFEERQCQAIIREFQKSSSSKQQPAKADPKDESPSLKRKYSQLQETPKKRKQSQTQPNSPVRALKVKQQAKTESSNKSQEPSSANSKFFPLCERSQSCQFYHPTVKCMYFPKCREGSACMFMHEPCRFEEKCTRVDCCYDHRYRPKHLQNINALLRVSRLFLNSQSAEMVDLGEHYSD